MFFRECGGFFCAQFKPEITYEHNKIHEVVFIKNEYFLRRNTFFL